MDLLDRKKILYFVPRMKYVSNLFVWINPIADLEKYVKYVYKFHDSNINYEVSLAEFTPNRIG